MKFLNSRKNLMEQNEMVNFKKHFKREKKLSMKRNYGSKVI